MTRQGPPGCHPGWRLHGWPDDSVWDPNWWSISVSLGNSTAMCSTVAVWCVSQCQARSPFRS